MERLARISQASGAVADRNKVNAAFVEYALIALLIFSALLLVVTLLE